MNNPAGDLRQLLMEIADTLQQVRFEGDVSRKFVRLAAQVDEPCVVTVVGRVKAGKSTFINALLGEELAKTGTQETTATINYFRYGSTDPALPVRCHWRSGRVTEENLAFLDSVQGNDAETLLRSEAIEKLEYHLLNPYLQTVTLVDTPGTGAVVDEHQNATAEFMRLSKQLRERHDAETNRLERESDAIIYLLGAVAHTQDQGFLDDFRDITRGQSRALNAVGVLAKVDLQPELLKRRKEIAAKIASQLKDGLETVVPVSAGLHQASVQLLADDKQGLIKLVHSLRSVPIETLQKMLKSEGLFFRIEAPLSNAERQALLGNMPWRVFATVAEIAADLSLDVSAVAAKLAEISGFGLLKEVLERQFFKRGRLLRCFRIVEDARALIDDARYVHLRALRKRENEDRARRERFITYLEEAKGNNEIKKELHQFLVDQLSGSNAGQLGALLDSLSRKLDTIHLQLSRFNDDFEALQWLQDVSDLFTPYELIELHRLFGLYGDGDEARLPEGIMSLQRIQQRQQHWRDLSRTAQREATRRVAESAVASYGFVLDAVLAKEGLGTDV